jgi:phage portal protein BeeE
MKITTERRSPRRLRGPQGRYARQKGRVEAREHPLWDALALSPDGESTSIRTRQAMHGHVLGHGNGYAEIGFLRDGRAARFYPLDPTSVQPDRTPITKALYYDVDGKSFAPRRVLHVAG